jgi:hypothetical protein
MSGERPTWVTRTQRLQFEDWYIYINNENSFTRKFKKRI